MFHPLSRPHKMPPFVELKESLASTEQDPGLRCNKHPPYSYYKGDLNVSQNPEGYGRMSNANGSFYEGNWVRIMPKCRESMAYTRFILFDTKAYHLFVHCRIVETRKVQWMGTPQDRSGSNIYGGLA